MKLDIASSSIDIHRPASGVAAADSASPPPADAAAAPVVPLDLARSTHGSMRQFGDNKGKQYLYKLVHLTLWLFDNHRESINAAFIPQMIAMNVADEEECHEMVARRGTNSNAAINRRSNLHRYVKLSIQNTLPDGDQGVHNCPINIDGAGVLTHSLIKAYMQTKKNNVWVDLENAQQLDVTITDEMINDEGKVKCTVYQSLSHFCSIWYSIVYLYKIARVPLPEDMSSEMTMFLRDMDRIIRNTKENLGL